MEQKFTPKQVALALGVSESSVKRWVDNGKIEAVKTAGGHRKLALAAIVQMAREQGYQIIKPEVLGLAAESSKRKLVDVRVPLLESLLAGDESASQAIIEPLYHAGHTMVEIADSLLAPVFHEIGDRWARGEVDVHQERRACEIAVATLHNLRRMLPLPTPGAPRALAMTPSEDHAELPIRLVELVLREKGWDSRVQGISLPLEEICAAVTREKPELSLLSVTHQKDVGKFVDEVNTTLLQPTNDFTRWIVGGQAFGADHRDQLDCWKFSMSMDDLAEAAELLIQKSTAS